MVDASSKRRHSRPVIRRNLVRNEAGAISLRAPFKLKPRQKFLSPAALAGVALATVVLSVAIVYTRAATVYSLWADSVVPAYAATSGSEAVELGVRFKANADGYVNGIKFYKGAGNTGTHTGSVWSTSGARLATATFGNETATGWQKAYFSSPLKISAGITYVASYFAPQGHYAFNAGYFQNKTQSSGPLTALVDASAAPNGAFKLAGGFPNSSYNGTNYWVDVLYTKNTAVPLSTPALKGNY